MIRSEHFIQKLKNEFIANHPNGPKLNLSWKEGGGEGYSLEYAGGEFFLKGDSLSGAVYGLSLLKTIVASGHIAEYLGKRTPKLPLRILWINNLNISRLFKDLRLRELIAERALFLGYNTIGLEVPVENGDNLGKLLETFRSYGLRACVKVGFQPQQLKPLFDKDFGASVEKLLQAATSALEVQDFIHWESTIYNQLVESLPKPVDWLQKDQAEFESTLLQKSLQGRCRLIYYIPTPDPCIALKQSRWIPDLCRTLSSQTIVAFSSYAGDPLEDHMPPHPLWEKLRKTKVYSHLNILPFVNVGLVNQGEGFWPIVPIDQIDHYLTRCHPSLFSGVAVMTAHLPKENALLSCNLWTAAGVLWGNGSPWQLAETWMEAYFPELLKYTDLGQILHHIHQIAVQVRSLELAMNINLTLTSKDEYRLLSESLLSRLRFLQVRLEKQKSDDSKIPSLKDRFIFFARDSRRLILRFLQHHQMPLVNVLNGEDLKESFWTDVATQGAKSLTSTVRVVLREEPNKGMPESALAKIYEEVMDM